MALSHAGGVYIVSRKVLTVGERRRWAWRLNTGRSTLRPYVGRKAHHGGDAEFGFLKKLDETDSVC